MTTLAQFREAAAKKLDDCAITSSSLVRRAVLQESAEIVRAMPIPEVKDGEVRPRHSGCACYFDDDGETVIKWCRPHAEYKRRAEKAEALLETLQAAREDAREVLKKIIEYGDDDGGALRYHPSSSKASARLRRGSRAKAS